MTYSAPREWANITAAWDRLAAARPRMPPPAARWLRSAAIGAMCCITTTIRDACLADGCRARPSTSAKMGSGERASGAGGRAGVPGSAGRGAGEATRRRWGCSGRWATGWAKRTCFRRRGNWPWGAVRLRMAWVCWTRRGHSISRLAPGSVLSIAASFWPGMPRADGEFTAAIDYMQPAADFGNEIGHPLGPHLQAEIAGWQAQLGAAKP